MILNLNMYRIDVHKLIKIWTRYMKYNIEYLYTTCIKHNISYIFRFYTYTSSRKYAPFVYLAEFMNIT